MSPILGIYASQISGHLVTNSYSSIATAYGGGDVTFSSIPQIYTHLQIRMFVRGTGTGGNSSNLKGTFININGDSSSTVPNHALYADGSSPYSGYNSDSRINVIPQTVPSSSATANVYGTMIMDIFDYTNVNKFKTFRGLTGADVNGGGIIGLFSAAWQNTNAITSIKIGTNEAYTSYSQIALYGVK